MSRFHAINTRLVRELRQKRGWSQKELAKRAGYSERLIRKAEFGGTLDVDTIHSLAEALSTFEEKITFQTIVHDGLSIARTFVSGYEQLGQKMISAIEPYFTTDFKFYMAGDPQSAPFIGTWHGKDGFQQFLDLYFGVVTRGPGTLQPTYLVNADSVIARYADRVTIFGQPDTVLWTFLHFWFRDGLLCMVEHFYDTQAANQLADYRLGR